MAAATQEDASQHLTEETATDSAAVASAAAELEDFEEGDNTTSNGQGESKEEKPVLTGDAEADEHDILAMPSIKAVQNDIQFVNRSRRVVIHTATMYDMVHDVIGEIMKNQACDEMTFQFIRGKDEETGMQGVISMTFSSTKQATEYIPYLQSIREDLVIQHAPPSDVATNLVSKWKKERSASNPSAESMLLVKNLDPATASVEKLTAIFPDADDIVIASQLDASNQGKLKGRKHGYLLYKNPEDAQVALETYHASPVELNGESLIVLRYKEPPNHIPGGYLTLSARKLVLRHIARFKGLLVRAQEDPLLPVKDGWSERLKYSTELIEKDDAARDSLGLPKPTLTDFKDMTNLKNVTGKQADILLAELKLADKPTSDSTNAKKRSFNEDSKPPKKQARGAAMGGARGGRGGRGAGGVKPLMSGGGGGGMRPSRYGFSTGAGCSSGIGFSMGGYGGDYADDYDDSVLYGGRVGFSQGVGSLGPRSAFYTQRLSLIRAAARAALRGGRGGWM